MFTNSIHTNLLNFEINIILLYCNPFVFLVFDPLCSVCLTVSLSIYMFIHSLCVSSFYSHVKLQLVLLLCMNIVHSHWRLNTCMYFYKKKSEMLRKLDYAITGFVAYRNLHVNYFNKNFKYQLEHC